MTFYKRISVYTYLFQLVRGSNVFKGTIFYQMVYIYNISTVFASAAAL